MKLIEAGAVEVFIKPIGGNFGPCPVCGSDNVYLLATTNEWKWRCNNPSGCRARFNDAGEVLDA